MPAVTGTGPSGALPGSPPLVESAAMSDRKTIAVIGGGSAGFTAARTAARRLPFRWFSFQYRLLALK